MYTEKVDDNGLSIGHWWYCIIRCSRISRILKRKNYSFQSCPCYNVIHIEDSLHVCIACIATEFASLSNFAKKILRKLQSSLLKNSLKWFWNNNSENSSFGKSFMRSVFKQYLTNFWKILKFVWRCELCGDTREYPYE